VVFGARIGEEKIFGFPSGIKKIVSGRKANGGANRPPAKAGKKPWSGYPTGQTEIRRTVANAKEHGENKGKKRYWGGEKALIWAWQERQGRVANWEPQGKENGERKGEGKNGTPVKHLNKDRGQRPAH